MKTIQVPDEVYEQLRDFVVDPFDDTPTAVLQRVLEIAKKAQRRWSPFGGDDGKQEGPKDYKEILQEMKGESEAEEFAGSMG